MKPLKHSYITVKKFGGDIDSHLKIHNFLDSSKLHIPDARHRLLLHNTFGIQLCEQLFGTYVICTDGKKVSVRDIAENHIITDLGYIPTVYELLKDVPQMNNLMFAVKDNYIIVD